MSESAPLEWSIPAAVFAGIAVASVVCLPFLLRRLLLVNSGSQLTDGLRDRAPWPFRVSRNLTLELIRYVDRHLGARRRASLMRRLQVAGLHYAVTPAEIVVMGSLTSTATAIVLVMALWAHELLRPGVLLPTLLLVPIAYVYVELWLCDAGARRKRLIDRDFPFFLDVVVLSMKAGLAFPGAMEQATSQLPDGPMRQEMQRLLRDVRTGTGRGEALQQLAQRVRMASISNFVAVVAQADESGGSLTRVLYEQARQRRRERFQRAEKLANQAPVKLLFPLVAFLFPVTFIIIGFPLYEQLAGSGFFAR